MKVACCVVGYDEKTRVLLHYQIGHDEVIPSFYFGKIYNFKKVLTTLHMECIIVNVRMREVIR